MALLFLASGRPEPHQSRPVYRDIYVYLGYLVYARERTGPLTADSTSAFGEITARFQEGIRSDETDVDSLVIGLERKYPRIDFRSADARVKIRRYLENYQLVEDVIFGKIKDDADEAEMQKVEDKILQVPAVAKIYREYVPVGSKMESLSSSGVALYVQLGYYLYSLDIVRRNEVLKELL